MTTPAPSPSPVYTFDVKACDAIIAKHYPNFEAALDEWRSAEYKANPARYDDPNTVMEALAQAEEFLQERFDEHEASEGRRREDTVPSDADLERVLRDIVRRCRSKDDIVAAIRNDDRFTADPDVDGDSVSITVSRADYGGTIIVYEFLTLAFDLGPSNGPSEDELKNALRGMVRRSRDEKELRSLIAADNRFVGEPAISAPKRDGAFLSSHYTQIMVSARHNGETIQI